MKERSSAEQKKPATEYTDDPLTEVLRQGARDQWHSLKHKISQKSINLNFLFL